MMTTVKSTLKMAALAVLCNLCLLVQAQLNYDYTAGKFLIKGKVVDINTRAGVPMANIKIKASGRGVTCNGDGTFTMYVSKADSLDFTSTGYNPRTYRMADLDSSKYYTLEIELIQDFIKLHEVTIYPFKDVEEFKTAFVETKHLRIDFMGIAPPKYSNITPKTKFSNPISFMYDKLKKKSAADPEFKP